MTRLRDDFITLLLRQRWLDDKITWWQQDCRMTRWQNVNEPCFSMYHFQWVVFGNLMTWFIVDFFRLSDSLNGLWPYLGSGQSRDTLVLAERFAARCDRCDMFVEAWWSSIHLIWLALDLDDDGDDDDNDGDDNNDDDRQYFMSMMLYSPGWPRILSLMVVIMTLTTMTMMTTMMMIDSMMLYSPGWPRILSPNASPTSIHHPKPPHRHYFWNIFTC